MTKTYPLLLDGALGTSLIAAGLPSGACPEAWILESAEHEQVVRSLVRRYVESGSRFVYTPTFGANAATLQNHSLSHRTTELNRRLAALVREEIDLLGVAVTVVGDLSPTGRFLAPMGDATFEELVGLYREQIAAMNELVDAFVCETNLQLADARAALFAARLVDPQKPFFASFTLAGDTTTLGGTDVRAAAVSLFSLGAHAVGVNCSTGPEAMQPAVGALSLLRPKGRYILAKPNAGLPDSEGHFSLSPEEFAQKAALLVPLGADLIGGCCGTSPDYLAALAKVLPTDVTERAGAAIDTLICSERCVFDAAKLTFPEPITVDDNTLFSLDFSAEALHLYFADVASAARAAELFCYLPSTALCFSAASAEALEAALFVYQGRAAVCMDNLSEKEKEHISTTYSPVLQKG
ncbi:MAG: homocysteine S-methyltransferase family protein [Clostridia bacterium]|nr:homocysteine S-methyltransferase family protein [Clostridia bacterium]